MVAPRRSPCAEDLPLPQRDAVARPAPKTPRELDARHRKIKDAIVAVAKILAPR